MKICFWSGLDDQLFQLLPAGATTYTLAQYIDYALWLSGSPFTVGEMKEEDSTTQPQPTQPIHHPIIGDPRFSDPTCLGSAPWSFPTPLHAHPEPELTADLEAKPAESDQVCELAPISVQELKPEQISIPELALTICVDKELELTSDPEPTSAMDPCLRPRPSQSLRLPGLTRCVSRHPCPSLKEC